MATNQKILIIVENESVPFDSRVWKEARSLHEHGYQVTVLCPKRKGYVQSLEVLDGIHIYRHPTATEGNSPIGYLVELATGDAVWAEKARFALDWLIERQTPGYSGSCWGNHFDYQCRSFYLPKGVPTVVWTSLIGHGFLDGYQHFMEARYLEVARSACYHILRDLEAFRVGDGVCITYVPGLNCQVHNANTLGASLLARTYSLTRDELYRDLAQKAIRYTVDHQRPDGSWYYGEKENLHWVDNFHTAYVLDCLKYYGEGTGDRTFEAVLAKGYQFWKSTFFLADGTPKYYDFKTLPIDIQCSSQAIDTLVNFHDPDSLELALKVAHWMIQHMQDRTGYFYYPRYSSWLVNKTPTLHWGQATMFCALAGLYRTLQHAGKLPS